ncbi:MAG: hypothetical protein ACAI25_16975 [Planctomycetota bacterium]
MRYRMGVAAVWLLGAATGCSVFGPAFGWKPPVAPSPTPEEQTRALLHEANEWAKRVLDQHVYFTRRRDPGACVYAGFVYVADCFGKHRTFVASDEVTPCRLDDLVNFRQQFEDRWRDGGDNIGAARDAWGRVIIFRAPGNVHRNGWDIWSCGPNGRDEDGGGDDLVAGEDHAFRE